MTGALPTCEALWIGSALGPLERTCLASFVAAGHRVRLHAYAPVEGVPAGVDTVDAARVLPPSDVVRHRATGSASLFSNRFRYALLRSGGGVWIDCDVLCLRPLPSTPFLFGRQDARLINGAVLSLPADHPVLADLEAIFTTPRWVPPWARRRRRLQHALRYRFRRGYGLADMRWGTTGPEALTHHLRAHGLEGHALAPEVLYPVAWREAALLTDPDPGPVWARITDRTRCVHLWRQALRDRGATPAPTSFLGSVSGQTPTILGPVPGPTPKTEARPA